MQSVMVRKIVIGEGMPKICVPVVEREIENILEAAKLVRQTPADLVEWRADWYEEVLTDEKNVNVQGISNILERLREILEEIPLLVTFRTAKEGGKRDVDAGIYEKFQRMVAESGCADLMDVELFSGKAKELVEYGHAHGVKVMLSNHDFVKTPGKEEIMRRLWKMQKLGADIAKIAVMPQSRRDVLTLLEATEELNREGMQIPIVTMSMGSVGAISRLCGEVFGSAITFGTTGKASAPGQLEVNDLKGALELLHETP